MLNGYFLRRKYKNQLLDYLNYSIHILSVKSFDDLIVCEISLISENELIDLGNTILVNDKDRGFIKQILLQYFQGDHDSKFRSIRIGLNDDNLLPVDVKATNRFVMGFEQFFKNHRYGSNYINKDGGLIFHTSMGTQSLYLKKLY
ncbi:hypothetical protein [Cellulophaga baltica]|nr:hypothetical protein [Cellulophaga baltica]